VSLTLTPEERAAAYNAGRFGQRYPASRLSAEGGMVTGVWYIGNDFRNKTRYYGAYPARYLQRVDTMFPEAEQRRLHLFSGSVGCDDVGVLFDGDLFDVKRDPAQDAHRLGQWARDNGREYDLILADPPYGAKHAAIYGTKMIDRKRVFRQMAEVVPVGGCVVWLDTKRPMYRKAEWREWGCVGVVRSTNHDVRAAFFFERRVA
jgi:hypothetical protein